jgi:hydrogenase expression/formation protein HypD
VKLVDEFRDNRVVGKLLAEIKKTGVERASFMEVCGTHTMAIFRFGLREMLGNRLTLISGPGCPVCVTAQTDIDRIISLARSNKVILATFGDMLKVPGTTSSLEKERAAGADIRVVYSPADALALACNHKNRQVVFIGVGFETTSPAVAAVVSDARKSALDNFSIYCCHKLIPPAMKALLDAGDTAIDGFLCPGHVSSIIGSETYGFICADYGIPCVVTGFEPTDILASILVLLRQKMQKKARVAIQYTRAVEPRGNMVAQKLLKEVFETGNAQWRGLGIIANSGYTLRKGFERFDAEKRFRIRAVQSKEDPRCLCGLVLRGIKTPDACRLFAKDCAPEHPIGPCMVSTEGTCAAWYKYGPKNEKTEKPKTKKHER